MVVQKAAPINGPNYYYNWIYLEKVRKSGPESGPQLQK